MKNKIKKKKNRNYYKGYIKSNILIINYNHFMLKNVKLKN